AIARCADPPIVSLGLNLSRVVGSHKSKHDSSNGEGATWQPEAVRGQWTFERRRRPKFHPGNSGRTYISPSPQDLLLLLLGVVSAHELASSDRLRPSNKTAARSADALFMSRPARVSPLDDVMNSL